MRQAFPLWLLLTLATAVPARPAAAELALVWAVDDGTKVRADELKHPLQAGNGIFWRQGRQVRLFGLRNETIAFQVILRGGAAATDGVRVRLDAVGALRNGAVSDAPERYLLDRRIELFEEHYLQIVRRSGDRLPAGIEGPVPDALIPHRRPFSVPARVNRAIWIDLHIPRSAPAGLHRGVLNVEVQGRPCQSQDCRLTVELVVLPRSLPEQSAARTMLWFSGSASDAKSMAARYRPLDRPLEQAKLAQLRLRHYQLARQHRVTLILGAEDAPDQELGALISGQAFTRAAGYDGPGQGIGQDLYSIHTYGGTLTPAQARMWTTWFAAHGPQVEYFLYVYDEPHDPALFAKINAVAAAARPVPSLVTARRQPGLEIDIYATAPSEFSVEDARRASAAGKRVWIYNGERPRTGTFLTDDTAVATRVNPWLQWRYGIPRWFYWESTYYLDFQGGRGAVNVFRDPITFSNRHGDRLNGDGVLFYPGRDLVFPAEDRGFDMPLPSIRLKNWRRGLQDFDYLELLRKDGLGAFATAVAGRLIPRALDQVNVDEPASWPDDGERWLEARRLLFTALQTGVAPNADLQRLARPPESVGARAQRLALRWWRGKLRRAMLLGLVGSLAVFVLWSRRRRRNPRPRQ